VVTTIIDRFAGEHAFLSNFYPSPIPVGVFGGPGFVAPTVEHAFQATKVEFSEGEPDLDLYVQILRAASPGVAKRLGRRVEIAIRAWDAVRDEVMAELIGRKFAVGSPLADQLLATGGATLVEGNAWGDRYWGRFRGEGENVLGEILMDRRDRLRWWAVRQPW
jgi:ribA/ribD-fused uncharacterized protein